MPFGVNTGGGSLDLGSTATSGPARGGNANVGGLTVNAAPGNSTPLILGAVVIALAFFFMRRK